MALVWDFAREIAAGSPGNTTSYYDEACQSFYVDSGTIRTQVAQLDDGQWQDITPEAEAIISPTGIAALDIEHHYNGLVAGSAQHDSDVVLLIYEYMADVSTWLKSGLFQAQADTPSKAGRITLKNVDKARFEDSSFTLFAPGNKIVQNYMSGDSGPFEMGTFYIESSPYAEIGEEFTFQGRNLLGFMLANQTLDEHYSYSGTLTEMFTAMLTSAGIPATKILVQTSASTGSFTFDPADKYLKSILAAAEQVDWYVDDLPDGTIVIGDADFIRLNVASTGIYSFNRGSEVFTRKVERDIDGMYSRVCVRRGGPNPLSVYADVPYFDGWNVGSHKTYYQKVGDDVTDATMSALCTQLVDGLQYAGITETFDGPFRPWLQIGDVGYVTGDERLAGIITEFTHQYGEGGYFTAFSVTSGGTISNPDNPATVASKYVGRMGGANRQRRLLDYILSSAATASREAIQTGAITYQAAVAGGYLGDEQTLNEHLAKVADGAVVPAGGFTGQRLIKASNDDYDTGWADESIWGGM